MIKYIFIHLQTNTKVEIKANSLDYALMQIKNDALHEFKLLSYSLIKKT